MACADVTSANIVGYNTTELSKNFYAGGASFVTIGEDGFKFSDIKLQGVGASAVVPGSITIQTLDDGGNKDKIWKYYQNVKSGAWKGKLGWFDEDGEQMTIEHDYTFPAGTGLWIKGLAGASLQMSGEVFVGELTITLNKNFALLCNPFPCEITLAKNIELGGVSETAIVPGSISIQTLDDGGNKDKIWKYYQNVKSGAWKGKLGWFDEDGNQITEDNDATFPAGKGLWVKGLAGATLTFKSPVK